MNVQFASVFSNTDKITESELNRIVNCLKKSNCQTMQINSKKMVTTSFEVTYQS